MSKTLKMSNGLAFEPEKDLAMFSRMAAGGKRLSGFSSLGHGWTFTDAPPEDAVFDLAYERDPDTEYFDIFRAAGWSPVVSMGDAHVFKAKPGTPPVHTTRESRSEELQRQQKQFTRYSIVTVSLWVLLLVLLQMLGATRAVLFNVLLLAAVPVVYTVLPLLGYTWRSRALRSPG